MRAMPIILDLIVLLTIFAVTLFYTAIGNSAPNEDTTRVVMFEVSSSFDGEGEVHEQGGLVFRAWLTLDGTIDSSGEVIPLARIADGTQRFLVRNPSKGAEINFAARAVNLRAFSTNRWSVTMRRAFPGGEIVVQSSAAGRLPVLSMEVSPS